MPPPDHNLTYHAPDLSRAERFSALKSSGATLWLTGLSGSGKSTIAAALERTLVLRGVHAYVLDGDNIRLGLNRGLGFSHDDRAENIRRIAEVARLFADSGALAIAAFVSPYRADRDNARKIHESASLPFLEVHLDTPLATCEQRDPKGLYKKARRGELKNFTGIDDPYEPPLNPELTLHPHAASVEACVQSALALLQARSVLK